MNKENSEPYLTIAQEIGKLVETKQKQYGDAFGQAGKVLKVLYPNGINIEQYDDLLCLLRILDKLFRIAQRGKVIDGESPYLDIAGYGLLGCVRDNNKDRNK